MFATKVKFNKGDRRVFFGGFLRSCITSNAVRASIVALCLLAAPALAKGPEYFSSREWIEKHTPENNIPKEQRLFVGDAKQTSRTFILQYREGISLREIIDATHLKTNDVMVTVLRSDRKTEPVFDELVKSSTTPRFAVRAQDVIWLSTWPFKRN